MNKDFTEDNVREILTGFDWGNGVAEDFDDCLEDISKLQCPKCKELQDLLADISQGLDKLGKTVEEIKNL